MDKFAIEGGVRLRGEIEVSGAKNSALPALAACLLTEEPVILHRIPRVRDVRTMEKLIAYTGASVERNGGPGPHSCRGRLGGRRVGGRGAAAARGDGGNEPGSSCMGRS